MNSKQALLCIFLLLSAAHAAAAKSWRGIEPLHSTRADVERLLGPPNVGQSAYNSIYDFPEGRVSISFADGKCEEGLPGGWRLLKDTVVNITIALKDLKKIEELLTPGKEYEQVKALHTQHIYYFNADEGVSFQVWEGEVQNISYGPTSKDKDYSCGEYKYAVPVPPGVKLNSMEHVAFDRFGYIRISDAKARLDNFVIHLFELKTQAPEFRGYIIVYAGRRSYLGEAQHIANCYKNYLVRVRKMDAGSLFAVDGGFRDEIAVELYIGRADFYPPTLWPTLSPKKAHIIKRRLKSCYVRRP